MLERFSATIEKLYAAAADASLWEEALRAVEDYTGSTGAVLNLVPTTESAQPIALAGSFSRDDCAHYAAHYMWRCPRIAFARDHPEIPIHYDRIILSESEMDRDATYEWYGKHGLRYYVAGWIGHTDTHRAYMSLQRSRQQGHVEAAQVDQFSLVLPHMAQAVSLANKLGTLENLCSWSLGMLDSSRHAIFLLDADGKVALTNSRADELTASADGLAVIQGRLFCRSNHQQPLFDKLISNAMRPQEDTPRGGWFRIRRASGRRSFEALVSPLIQSEPLVGSSQPTVMVLVTDVAEAAEIDQDVLKELFGLTEAEARLASAFSAGHSLESASALLGVQPGTTRCHLKHVFRKMKVSRQQDLIRMLTGLSEMQRAGAAIYLGPVQSGAD